MKARNIMSDSIERMLDQVLRYGETHRRLYGSNVGDDGFIGPEIEQILHSCRALLNGELGDADGGTMDRRILSIASALGISEEDL